MEIPIRGLAPIGVLELVLHVEEPDADRGRQQHHGAPAGEELDRPDEDRQHGRRRRCGGVGAENAEPGAEVSEPIAKGKAIAHQQHVGGADAEQHCRMAIDAIEQALPRRGRAVLGDGERGDITHAAPAETNEAKIKFTRGRAGLFLWMNAAAELGCANCRRAQPPPNSGIRYIWLSG